MPLAFNCIISNFSHKKNCRKISTVHFHFAGRITSVNEFCESSGCIRMLMEQTLTGVLTSRDRVLHSVVSTTEPPGLISAVIRTKRTETGKLAKKAGPTNRLAGDVQFHRDQKTGVTDHDLVYRNSSVFRSWSLASCARTASPIGPCSPGWHATPAPTRWSWTSVVRTAWANPAWDWPADRYIERPSLCTR